MASHGVPRLATTVIRSEAARQEELAKIGQYQDLVRLIQEKVANRDYSIETLNLTSKLLKKNPEFYTIWNVRKRLLTHSFSSKSSGSSSPLRESLNTSLIDTTKASTESSFSSTSTLPTVSTTIPPSQSSHDLGKNGITHDEIETALRDDLIFLVPLLMEYPKCYWIWNHRFWLLNQANERLDVDTARRIWQEELGLVGKMLNRDSRNFHGWGYRRKIVSQLESPKLRGSSMVEQEFAYTTRMITSSLSNFSAWHYRSMLIPRLLEERDADDVARRTFQDQEFDFIKTALWTDPGDQSIWFYYQFLMTTLVDEAGFGIMCPNMTVEVRAEYVENQLSDLKELLEEETDCKWLYDALLEYTIALSSLQQRPLTDLEGEQCRTWLSDLRRLDNLRSGRWNALDTQLNAS